MNKVTGNGQAEEGVKRLQKNQELHEVKDLTQIFDGPGALRPERSTTTT
jgi:hypothetical protein